MYQQAIKTIKNYQYSTRLIQLDDYSLFTSSFINNTNSLQLLYIVRKKQLQNSQNLLFTNYIKLLQQNKHINKPKQQIHLPIIEFIQSQTSYYIVFQYAQPFITLAVDHKNYIFASNQLKNKLVNDLQNILFTSNINISQNQLVVWSPKLDYNFKSLQQGVKIICNYNKTPGVFPKEHNKIIFFKLVYMLYFGQMAPSNSSLRKSRMLGNNFFEILQNHYLKSDLGNRLNNYIQEQKNKNSLGKIVEYNDEDIQDQICNMVFSVDSKLKKLAYDIRQTRNSYNQQETDKNVNLNQLGIQLENDKKSKHTQQKLSKVKQENIQNSKLTNKQINTNNNSNFNKNTISSILPFNQNSIDHHAETNISHLTNLKSQNKTQYDAITSKTSLNMSASKNKSNNQSLIIEFQNNQNLQASKYQQNLSKISQIKTIQQIPIFKFPQQQQINILQNKNIIDQTSSILKSVKASFMQKINKKSILDIYSSVDAKNKKSNIQNSKQIFKNNQPLPNLPKQRTPIQHFQHQLSAYLTQFQVFHMLIQSFIPYYKTSNMGIVASYLISRSLLIRKKKLISALMSKKDIFNLGQQIMDKLNLQRCIERVTKDMKARQKPEQYKTLINFKIIPKQTILILQPYLGQITQDDRTEQMCFYYLYTMSLRQPNKKDIHHLLLYDVLYLLLHSNFQIVYEWKKIPRQWDENYVKQKKTLIELLMFKLK